MLKCSPESTRFRSKLFIILLMLFWGLTLQGKTESNWKVAGNFGFVNGGSIGYLIFPKEESDLIQYLKIEYMTAPYYTSYGGINIEVRKDRKFYYVWSAGFDFGKIVDLSFDLGGSNADRDYYTAFIIPHITFGLGYNFATWKHSSAYIEWDIGLKASVTNINLGVTF